MESSSDLPHYYDVPLANLDPMYHVRQADGWQQAGSIPSARELLEIVDSSRLCAHHQILTRCPTCQVPGDQEHTNDPNAASASRAKHRETGFEKDADQKFKCPETGCHRSYTRSNKLKVHISSYHWGHKPAACEYCSQKFANATDLRRHNLVHLVGVVPHQCPDCKASFKRRDYLLEHRDKHCKARKAATKPRHASRDAVSTGGPSKTKDHPQSRNDTLTSADDEEKFEEQYDLRS